MEDGQQDRAVGSYRVWEAAVAVFFLVFGAIVVWDSRRLGASWAEDGPQAGYFPFYIGMLIIIASLFNLYGAFSKAGLAQKAFVHREQLKMVLTVMVPSILYVVLIDNPLYSLGIYEASVLFIAFFMRYLGKYAWPAIAGVSLAVMAAFFMMFEVWFKVPLPKGPIEALLGFQ
jgi:putative tricarboxylic transport membrane protein